MGRVESEHLEGAGLGNGVMNCRGPPARAAPRGASRADPIDTTLDTPDAQQRQHVAGSAKEKLEHAPDYVPFESMNGIGEAGDALL
jgi:hypothetical protein